MCAIFSVVLVGCMISHVWATFLNQFKVAAFPQALIGSAFYFCIGRCKFLPFFLLPHFIHRMQYTPTLSLQPLMLDRQLFELRTRLPTSSPRWHMMSWQLVSVLTKHDNIGIKNASLTYYLFLLVYSRISLLEPIQPSIKGVGTHWRLMQALESVWKQTSIREDKHTNSLRSAYP